MGNIEKTSLVGVGSGNWQMLKPFATNNRVRVTNKRFDVLKLANPVFGCDFPN